MEVNIKEEIEEMPIYNEEIDAPTHFMLDESEINVYYPNKGPLDSDIVSVDNIKEEPVKDEIDAPTHFMLDESEMNVYYPNKGSLDSDIVSVDNIKEEPVKDELLDENCDLKSAEILSDIDIVPINFVACGIKQEFTDEEQISLNEYESNMIENVVSFCKCDECGEVCPDKKSLRNHLKFHMNYKNYKCNECSIVFSKLKNLTAHLRSHKGLKSFKCTQCNEVFTPISDLDTTFSDKVYKHMLTHTPAKPLNSDYLCEFSTSTYVKVDDIPKVIVKNRFKCKECNRKFSNPRVLADHMQQVHKKVKPFTCSECNITLMPSNEVGKTVPVTVFNDLVYKHMRSHTAKKNFKCSVCGLAFSQSKELKDHKLESHAGVMFMDSPKKQLMRCSECHHLFSLRNFEKHRLTHKLGKKR